MIRTFGDFELDDSSRQLSRGGRRVRVTGLALDLLCFFVERSGEMISREDIKRQLWPGSGVELEHSVDVLINRLRAVLGDSGKDPLYIETIPRKGYRFLGPVSSKHHRKNGTARLTWIRRLGAYAVIAVLAAITVLLIVRTHYDKFVPRHHSSIAMATFVCFGVSINLFLAGATGRLYEFWSGRRGSSRLSATISSPAIRLALSFVGFAFLLAALYLGRRALVEVGLW